MYLSPVSYTHLDVYKRQPGRVVTNGMSHYARSGENINGGMLVGVTPEDFGTDHPLAGVAWQRQLEEAAFRLGGGGFLAPCQRVEDFQMCIRDRLNTLRR